MLGIDYFACRLPVHSNITHDSKDNNNELYNWTHLNLTDAVMAGYTGHNSTNKVME